MLDNTATVRPSSSDQAWTDVRASLHKEFGAAAFNSWIAPLAFVEANAGTLSLSAPSRFTRDWVKTHYADRIRQLWNQHGAAVARVDIAIGATAAGVPAEAPANANVDAGDAGVSSPLDPRFTFDTFVTGASNEMAHAAARRVADNDAAQFNPLFIYGSVGLGKTHLMQAIAQAVRAKSPARKVIYLSAEKFMYQFVRALRFKDTVAFKDIFRGADVLMIDDIQFICGKEATQEEFFHTFNALVAEGRQVVISSSIPPAQLEGLDERLKSRLGGGLAVAIQPADRDLRLAILHKKVALMRRDVPAAVLEFLADKVASNVRELEGALNRLIAHAELSGRALTVETAGELLADILRANDRRVTVDDIQKRVAEHYNIRMADMHSPRRARAVARPRQVAMYLAKALTVHSLPEIGRKFGGRDHTTIMHGVRKIEELLANDRCLQDDIAHLKAALAG